MLGYVSGSIGVSKVEVKAVDLQSNVPDNVRKMLDDCRAVAVKYATEVRRLEDEVRRLAYEAEILAIAVYFLPEEKLTKVEREVMKSWRHIIKRNLEKHINEK